MLCNTQIVCQSLFLVFQYHMQVSLHENRKTPSCVSYLGPSCVSLVGMPTWASHNARNLWSVWRMLATVMICSWRSSVSHPVAPQNSSQLVVCRAAIATDTECEICRGPGRIGGAAHLCCYNSGKDESYGESRRKGNLLRR